MEKFSLYTFLSILLPGAVFILYIEYVVSHIFVVDFSAFKPDPFLSIVLNLSVAVFFGSLIDALTRNLLFVYKFTHLFKPLSRIYPVFEAKKKSFIPFYQKWMDKLPASLSTHDKIEIIWNEIYYYLEANDHIAVPKSFQSLYFFFRNIFTLAGIIIIISSFLLFGNFTFIQYSLITGISLVVMILSIIAGSINRVLMVERMFWTYYSLKK